MVSSSRYWISSYIVTEQDTTKSDKHADHDSRQGGAGHIVWLLQHETHDGGGGDDRSKMGN